MRWSVLLRRGFYVLALLLLVVSLLGMFFTGPVVVRGSKYAIEVDPSPARLRHDVQRLCEEFGPRSHRYIENLDRTADWIAGELRRSGLEVELRDYEIDARRFRNVIARRPGADPQAGAIVIGAHYDTVADTPGANDNASGVAALWGWNAWILCHGPPSAWSASGRWRAGTGTRAKRPDLTTFALGIGALLVAGGWRRSTRLEERLCS